jgi:hypothetical protein
MTKRVVLSGIFTQDSQHKSAFTDAKWVLQYTNKIHKLDDIFKPEETDENAPAGGQLAIKRKLDQVQDVLGRCASKLQTWCPPTHSANRKA